MKLLRREICVIKLVHGKKLWQVNAELAATVGVNGGSFRKNVKPSTLRNFVHAKQYLNSSVHLIYWDLPLHTSSFAPLNTLTGTHNTIANFNIEVIEPCGAGLNITIVNSPHVNRLDILGQGNGILGVLPPIGPSTGKLGLLTEQPAAVKVLDVNVDAHDGWTTMDGTGAVALGISRKLHLRSSDGIGGVNPLTGTTRRHLDALPAGVVGGGIDGISAHVGLPSGRAQITLESRVGQRTLGIVDVDKDVVEIHHPMVGRVVAIQHRQVDGLDRLAVGDVKGVRFHHPTRGGTAVELGRLAKERGAVREGDVGQDGVVVEQPGAGGDGLGVAPEGDGGAGMAGAGGEGDGLPGPAVGHLDGLRAGAGVAVGDGESAGGRGAVGTREGRYGGPVLL